MLLSDKRLLSNDERKQILSTCMLLSTQKMKKNVPIVINDGKHTWRIEDGVFPLQLLSYNHEEADKRTAPDLSISSRNIAIVAKDTDILMFLIYSYSMCAISNVWVLKYDTNSYFDIGTICKYLGNTVSRNILHDHTITGCDITSIFYRISKINPF